MKRLFSCLLAALVLLGLFPASAQAYFGRREICVYAAEDAGGGLLSRNELCGWGLSQEGDRYVLSLQAWADSPGEGPQAERYTYRGRVGELDYAGTLLSAYPGEPDPNGDLILSYDRATDELRVLYDGGDGEIPIPQENLAVEIEYWQGGGERYLSLTVSGTVTEETAGNKRVTRTYTYRDATGAEVWSAALEADFTYDGVSAVCRSASCALSVDSDLCRALSKTVAAEGDTARAELVMGYKILGVTYRQERYELQVSCDPSGEIK